jgi:CHAT domain-containing protein/tetratricopeptide (TPR) repeat protein
MGFAALLWLVCVPALANNDVPTLEECDAQVLAAPNVADSYYCFYRSVQTHGRADDAVRRLESILIQRPKLHRARLILALIEDSRGSPRALELLRQAADGAAEAGDHHGEVYPRLSISAHLNSNGLYDEADAELAKARSAAEAEGSPGLLAWVVQSHAYQALDRYDHGKALRLYREAERLVFPEGDPQLQGFVLSGLGSAHWYIGDFATAMDYYRREGEHWQRIGNRFLEASALYNVALLSVRLADLGRLGREETQALQTAALKAAAAIGNGSVEAAVRILIGEGLEGQAALDEFEEAMAISLRTGDVRRQLEASRHIARETFLLGPEHQEVALRRIAEAIENARDLHSPHDVAKGLIQRASMIWESMSREEGVQAYLAALDAVEQIRNLQPEERMRARVFSRWVYPYYRLSGGLLGTLRESTTPDADLNLALQTIERMRARVLLDRLEAAQVSLVGSGDTEPLQQSRDELLERITELQGELLRGPLSEDQRRAALLELTSLETEEAALRDRIARRNPAFGAVHSPSIPTVADLQNKLGEDQALLSFQSPDDRYLVESDSTTEGGPWVIVVTKHDTRAFPIPRRHVLEEQIEVFLGLFGRRDGSESAISTHLYRALLAETLRWIPESTTRLVIVPDGVLHRLPFETLRAARDGEPLVERFEISYVPSANLWHRWKRSDLVATAAGVLALVDPQVPMTGEAAEQRVAGSWIAGLQGGPLPYAMDEARALLRHAGSGTLKTGAAANEDFLKTSDLAPYGALHLGAHAVADEARPDRSAVILAPGSPDEDGLLQMREIVELDLDGKVVILAGCRSARGELLEGEGVLGLARAFFQGGARVVVGSLWPVRDDETAALVEEFARQLARGRSVAASMAQARRVRMRAGATAQAWAGLVVLGDGDLVLVQDPGMLPRWWPWAATILLALVAALIIRLSRKKR